MSFAHEKGPRRAPAGIIVTCAIVLVECLALVVLGVIEVFSLVDERMTMGVTTTVFFFGYAIALGWCAQAFAKLRYWARSPLILAQLIQLGVAWSFRGGSTTWVAAILALAAVVALAGIFAPASLAAMNESED